MYCRNCGRELNDKWRICPYCKTNVRARGRQRFTSKKADTIDDKMEKDRRKTADERKIYSFGQEQEVQNDEMLLDAFFQIVAERYDYNYLFWKRWKKILTDISVKDGSITITTHYNGNVSKKKPNVQKFRLQDVLSTKVEMRPIWYLMDIIIMCVFIIVGIMMDITSRGVFLIGVTGILLCSYITLSKALVIRLKDGSKRVIFFAVEDDLYEFIHYTGIPLNKKTFEKMNKKRDVRVKRKIIDTLVVFVLGMALVVELMFAIMFGFRGNNSATETMGNIETNRKEKDWRTDETSNIVNTEQSMLEGKRDILEKEEDIAQDRPVEEFFFWDSDLRRLTDSEIYALSESERQMAINEIYARHGRMFNDSTVQLYFDCMSWYNGTTAPEDFDDSVFNEVELYNINALLNGGYVQAGIDFKGADGIYVSGTYEDSSSLYVEKIDAETISFRIGTNANGISGEANIVDEYTAVYDEYSFFSFTFTWSNSETVTVYHFGDSTGDSLVDEYTNGMKYWKASH